MIQSHLGELAALGTAFFWTATSMAFESAGKKIGSLTVNILRLSLALFFYSIFAWFTTGHFFPSNAGLERWLWLSLSGIVGFVLGDLFLIKAYIQIGARISSLLMALAPPIAAIVSWAWLGEQMTGIQILGMLLTLTGIAMVILRKDENNQKENKSKKIKFSYPLTGILFGLGGAVGQALGLVLSKKGMGDYDPFLSSQIRVIAGTISFTLVFAVMNRWKKITEAIQNRTAMRGVIIGTIFGPFLGVSFSLIAVQNTSTGIAATIMSIVPILIIPPAIFFFKEKISIKEIIGAFVAVGGVGLLFV